MKLSSLFLAGTALPLMLFTTEAPMAQPAPAAPFAIAQAEQADPRQAPPGARQRRPGQEDAEAPQRRERPDRARGQDAQEQGGSRGRAEERGPRSPRQVGQAGEEEAPSTQRRPREQDREEAPRRGNAPAAERERPTPPSSTAPARPERSRQDQPERPSRAPDRARTPDDSPARPQRPTAQERTPATPSPAERSRQQAPEATPPASRSAPAETQPRTRSTPSADEQPRTPGRPSRPDEPRPTTDVPRSDERPRGQRPGQERPDTPARAPAATETTPRTQPAPTAPAPAAPAAPAQETRPVPPTPAPTQAAPTARQPLDPARVRIEDLRNQRRQRVEDDGRRVIIEEPGNRTIIREGNQVIIRHDETERFRRTYRDADIRVERRGADEEVTIVRRPDGTEIITVRDERGNLIRRVRREQAGREVVLIENRRRGIDRRPGYGYVEEEVLRLPPPRVTIPREEYIVEADRASERDFVEAFTAPPVERIERSYTLDEVRRSQPLRERMRRVDLDTITFEFGSWELPDDQIAAMDGIARALQQTISQNPNEIFLVEGHTDAVGSDEDNLTLSDRRAETVATILTERYQIPAENLTTQGYGEQYLKVDTQAPEQENRRVTLRRITPLLQGQNQQ